MTKVKLIKQLTHSKKYLKLILRNRKLIIILATPIQIRRLFDDAIAMYKNAVEYNPEFVDAYLNLSMLYLDMELIDEAISLCKHAVKTNPDDAFLCFHLGEAYAMNMQYKEAIAEYNKAMNHKPYGS